MTGKRSFYQKLFSIKIVDFQWRTRRSKLEMYSLTVLVEFFRNFLLGNLRLSENGRIKYTLFDLETLSWKLEVGSLNLEHS